MRHQLPRAHALLWPAARAPKHAHALLARTGGGGAWLRYCSPSRAAPLADAPARGPCRCHPLAGPSRRTTAPAEVEVHSAGRSAWGVPRRCDAESDLEAAPERPPPDSATRAGGRQRAGRPVGRAASALTATARRRQGGAVGTLAAPVRRRRCGAARVRGRGRGRGRGPSRHVHKVAQFVALRPPQRARRVGRHHLLHVGHERLERRADLPLATPSAHYRAATHHRRSAAAACEAASRPATAASHGQAAASHGLTAASHGHSRAVTETESWRCLRPRLRAVRTGAARRCPARPRSGPGTAKASPMTSSMTSATGSGRRTARPSRCRQALARRPPAGKSRAADYEWPPSGSLLAEDHRPGVERVRRRADGHSSTQTGSRLAAAIWSRQATRPPAQAKAEGRLRTQVAALS